MQLEAGLTVQLPSQDEVEFWHKAEKSGWLQSQGEHLRTWRRRWFVLKQGFLFRFADQNVVANSKPRGIVDLSKVTDVSSGREATGKNNSITLSTEGGSVSHYSVAKDCCLATGLFRACTSALVHGVDCSFAIAQQNCHLCQFLYTCFS